MIGIYHYITEQTDSKDIGKAFPQVTCISLESAHRFDSSEFPAFIPELIFDLNKGAKVTDVLSQSAVSATGILISERLKNLLLEFDLMNHEYYPATIRTPKGNLIYYWLHLVNNSFFNDIDYQSSDFYSTRSGFKKGSININSYKDYKNKKEENGILWGAKAKKVKLLSSFNRLLDLFILTPFNYKIIISERLSIAFKENAITGIDIQEASFVE